MISRDVLKSRFQLFQRIRKATDGRDRILKSLKFFDVR